MWRTDSNIENEAAMKAWLVENWLQQSAPYFPDTSSSQPSTSGMSGTSKAHPTNPTSPTDLPVAEGGVSTEYAFSRVEEPLQGTSSALQSSPNSLVTLRGRQSRSLFSSTSEVLLPSTSAIPRNLKAVPNLPVAADGGSTEYAFSRVEEPLPGPSNALQSSPNLLETLSCRRSRSLFSSVSEILLPSTSALPRNFKAVPMAMDSSTDSSSVQLPKQKASRDLPKSFYEELVQKTKKLYHNLFNLGRSYSSFSDEDCEFSDSFMYELEAKDRLK